MKFSHNAVSILFAALTALAPLAAHAETAAEKGLSIAVETDQRDAGFSDSVAEATMELRDAAGTTTTRRFRMMTLEQKDDGDRTLVVFNQPVDLSGTAVLTWSHALTADDQWLYLPALKRTKRIASKNKAAAFIGSEYAFEDLSAWEVKKFTYRFLREESLEGVDCFVVENTPAYEDSGYSRQVEWVDEALYQPRRIDYYDREGALLKSMTFSNYKQYLGKHWRAGVQTMVNKKTGKSTRLEWASWRFKTGLTAADFTADALERQQ